HDQKALCSRDYESPVRMPNLSSNGALSQQAQIPYRGLDLLKRVSAVSSCRTVQVKPEDQSYKNSNDKPWHGFRPLSPLYLYIILSSTKRFGISGVRIRTAIA